MLVEARKEIRGKKEALAAIFTIENSRRGSCQISSTHASIGMGEGEGSAV